MAHSFSTCLYHCVWSTRGRAHLMPPALQERLFPYMAGIARENDAKAMGVGGVTDHVHLLLSLPATLPVAKAVQLIKGGASKWVHDTFPEQAGFGWQEGYGAFSIGMSQVEDTIAYIRSQRKHHGKISFQEEFLAFLKRHELEYDERYLWD